MTTAEKKKFDSMKRRLEQAEVQHETQYQEIRSLMQELTNAKERGRALSQAIQGLSVFIVANVDADCIE